jgi:hypothetical protein
MKHEIFAFLIFSLSIGTVRAEDAYSVEWLRSGCIAISKFENNQNDISDKEANDAVEIGVWIQGYLQAVEMLSYKSKGSINMVPKEWTNSMPASKSILAYLNEFEQKYRIRFPDAFEAKQFVNLWYYVKHPQVVPGLAYGHELIFLGLNFPEAFNAHNQSEKGEDEIGESVKIEINKRKIVIPIPFGMVRIDGRLGSLDDAVSGMAEPMNNRVYAVFGSPEDSRMIDAGEFPTLLRTVTIQHNEKLPATTSRADFARMASGLLNDLPKVDRSFAEHFDRIEESASRAMTDVTSLKSTMEFGETKSLGVFLSGDTFLCHSLLLHMKGSVGGEALSLIQATSVAAVWTDEQVVSIYANARYDKPDDLKWTRDICRAAVEALTGKVKR